MRIATVAAELNILVKMVGDFSSAYLEACAEEKVLFLGGPEFFTHEEHFLDKVNDLYGLRPSGICSHDSYKLYGILSLYC
jgi:hypothetical protein